MLPEMLPLRIRGTAMGFAIFPHWGANFAVSQAFPILLAAVDGGVAFPGYAVVVALLIVLSRVTETRGRSLEEIEADPQGKVAPA